jgi:hypothetical protein
MNLTGIEAASAISLSSPHFFLAYSGRLFARSVFAT